MLYLSNAPLNWKLLIRNIDWQSEYYLKKVKSKLADYAIYWGK